MLFSIIATFYNVEKYSKQCIESILKQKEKYFELILVDDGSSDRTPEILEEYSKMDMRIKVIHKKNGGITSARKAGAMLAKGDYVVIVDGDDWISEECLSEFKAIIEKYHPDMICSGYYETNDSGKILDQKYHSIFREKQGLVTKKDIDFFKKDIFNFPPNLWAKALKREIYTHFQISVEDEIRMGEDGMVIFPYLSVCEKIFLLKKYLYYYRLNPLSLTHQKRRNISFEGVLFRLQYLNNTLPANLYKRGNQISKYCCHAVINSALSQYSIKPFFEVNKQLELLLTKSIVKANLSYKPLKPNIKEAFAYYLLKNKLFLIIKLLSLK